MDRKRAWPTVVFLLITLGAPHAHANFGATKITREQRASLLQILPERLSDMSADPSIQTCLEAGRAGMDEALISLIAIDLGRDFVRKESDILAEAYARGASPSDLSKIRRGRATPGRMSEIRQARARLLSGQQFCRQLHQQYEAN